jgi:hypothetical protein
MLYFILLREMKMAKRRMGTQCGVLVCLSLVWMLGCDKKNDETQANGENAAPIRVSAGQRADITGEAIKAALPFDTILACWKEGRKQDAAAGFLALDWKNSTPFSALPALSLSESQYAALPQGQRESLAQDALGLTKDIREMTRYFVEQAKAAKAENKLEEAKLYHSGLMELGKILSGDDKLKLIQMIGKAVQGFTQKELGDLS